jgi:hypothetical protein
VPPHLRPCPSCRHTPVRRAGGSGTRLGSMALTERDHAAELAVGLAGGYPVKRAGRSRPVRPWLAGDR